jgi:hypothetical protein
MESRLLSRGHALTSPFRPSAPPWSSTAKAVSKGPAVVSRACPLRAVGSVPSVAENAPAVLGWRPGPWACGRRRGWPADALGVGARPHTGRSTRPPTRMACRTPAPARTRDIAQIDRPRPAPGRSGWTRAAHGGTLARGRAPHAPAAKARGLDPGPSPSPAPRATSAPSAQVTMTTSGVDVDTSPPARGPCRGPSGGGRVPRAALATGSPQPATGCQSPPLDPPSDHLQPSELLTPPAPPLRRRRGDLLQEILCDRRRRCRRAR